MDQLLLILPLLVFLVLLWTTYLNINLAVTIINSKKKDKTLTCCVSKQGKTFYVALVATYIIVVGFCLYSLITLLLKDDILKASVYLNIGTVVSLVVCYLLQQIIYIGSRQIMIGKVSLDYRKIKRVTYPTENKVRFTYGQKNYSTSLSFMDKSHIKKVLQKCR